MKLKNITILSFFLLIITGSNKLFAQSQTVSTDSISIAEAAIKQKQADQLKASCPHYPSTTTSQGGMSSSFNVAYKNWTTQYPTEYEAYKKIFNYK